MCDVPQLGALKKGTNEYIYPAAATKMDKYVCPDCRKDLILRRGQIRIHHFAHARDDNPCTYYNKPSESQIHKDAKMLMKSLLDKKKQITVIRECKGTCGNKPDEYEIPEISDTSKIIVEHRFKYNGLKIADVAYIDNKEIVCIFEIYNKHATEETNRPEPWFEIDAYELIGKANLNDSHIKINCIRKKCELCELVPCHRCKELCPKHIMYTNTNSKWCKLCDVDCWNKIFLEVSYSDKEKIKSHGGMFDPNYKKWHINYNNRNLKYILSKWKRWDPIKQTLLDNQLPPFRTMGRTATSTELLPLKTRLPTTAPSIMLVLGPSQLSP